MIEILLTRHGETECNVKNILCGGGNDSPLTDKGVLQAKALSISPHFLGVSQIWASTLGRAKHTAKIVADQINVPVCFDKRLIEQHGGIWEGRTFLELFNHKREEWNKNNNHDCEIVLEGGESRDQVRDRALNFLNELISKTSDNSKLLIVSHGAWVEYLVQSIGKLDSNFIRGLHIDNCSICRLEFENNEFRIRSLNETSHLMSNPELFPVKLLRI